jgi:hypothetical protein
VGVIAAVKALDEPPKVFAPVVVLKMPVPSEKSNRLVPVAHRRFLFAATVAVPLIVFAPLDVMKVPVELPNVFAALPDAVNPVEISGVMSVGVVIDELAGSVNAGALMITPSSPAWRTMTA